MTEIETALSEDANHLSIRKRLFCKIATYSLNTPILPLYKLYPSKETLEDVRASGADLFVWSDRTFLGEASPDLQGNFFTKETVESIALLKLSTYDDWWNQSERHKVRNTVRKAGKAGVQVRQLDLRQLNGIIDGLYEIYHDTPIRQGRRYIGYLVTKPQLRTRFRNLQNSIVIGAFLDEKIVGFVHVILGDRGASVRSLVSIERYMGVGVNNAILASAIETLCERGFQYFTYARMGYQRNLDMFKLSNGFRRFPLTTHFLALSSRGMLATHFYLQSEAPLSAEKTRFLLPIYDFALRVLPFPVDM